MYVMKNKILLINIIALFATNIEALKIKTAELSAGDVISINDLNSESTDTYGDIFNGNKAAQFIEVRDFADNERSSIEKKICLPFKDLSSYYYPEVEINGDSFLSQKIYNYTNRDNVFNVHPYYINKNASYGILKVCRIIKSQKVLGEILYEKDFPSVNISVNYKLLLDKTAVLRFKSENETYYISSIITGECFVQAYVNTVEICHRIDQSKLEMKNFIETSRFKSRVKIVNGHLDRERQINNYMDLIEITLLNLIEPSIQKSFYNIFAPIPEPSIIKLNLGTFPDLPKERPSPLITYEKLITDIVPGDVISVDDLKFLHSLITVDNFLIDIIDRPTSPFTHFDYTHCYPFEEDQPIRTEFAPYILHPNHSAESFHKFDVFDEVVKRRNFGVDLKYLNNRYKCLKVKVCSEFQRRKLIIPSVYVVNVDEDQTHKSRVFDSQNVVLRYRLGDETHYVARTEKGNCLFQALIYENLAGSSQDQQIQGPLLFKGKILSANSDQNLEEWAEKFVSDFPMKSYKTLVELINNRTAVQAIDSKLSRESLSKTMINIYLEKLN